MFELWPFTNFHDLNLDWLIRTFKEYVAKIDTDVETNATFREEMENDWETFTTSTYKEQIDEILEMHPEWTTTVMDGAITARKINSDFLATISNAYVTPEQFGAVGDGITDDTAAFQDALDQRGMIICEKGANYRTTAPLQIYHDTLLEMNNAEITCEATRSFYNFDPVTDEYLGYDGNGNIIIRNGTIYGGCMSFCHGHDILVDNMIFMNTTEAHFMEICACTRYIITNCLFQGVATSASSQKEYINIDRCERTSFPAFQDATRPTYDGTVNDTIIIRNNIFRIGTGAYAAMQDAVGVHSPGDGTENQIRIIIEENIVEGATDYAFSLLGMNNCVCRNNIATLGSSARFAVMGYGNNNKVVGNIARLESGSRAMIGLWYPETDLSVKDNEYYTGTGQDGHNIITGAGAPQTTFRALQKTFLGQGSNTTSPNTVTISSTGPALTNLNTLYVSMGTTTDGSWSEARVKAYQDRYFTVGNQCGYPATNSGSNTGIVKSIVTITDDHTLDFSVGGRHIYGAVEDMHVLPTTP